MWNPNYDTDELIYKKQKQTHRHRKQIYDYQGERKWARDKLGVWFGIGRYTNYYIKTNKTTKAYCIAQNLCSISQNNP